MLQQIFLDYLVTTGWAIVGSLSMGIGIILALKLFDWSTGGVDEWELVKQGNLPIAIILSSVVISLGIVISAAISPSGQGHISVVAESPSASPTPAAPADYEIPFGEGK